MTGDVTAPAATAVETPWRRLDPRMLVVSPLSGLVRLLPAFVVVLVTGREGDLTRVWISLGAAGLVVLLGVVRWRTTRYRITPERVELHSGWIRRQRRSVPRDRIRTVDLTSRLEHRLFRLSVVKVGSASGSSTEHHGLSLDAVSKAEADRLRRELLEHSPAAPAVAAKRPPEAVPAEVLARLDWSWLRFAPLTFSSLAGVGVIAAAIFNLLGELGVDPSEIGAVDDAATRLSSAPVWIAVGVVAVIVLAAAVLGALLLFTERWFAYRLTRERTGEGSALRVHRGLFTRRSLSVAERRMRGVEIVEPLLLRAGRGAQTRALSAGLARDAQGGVLQPPVPRAEAHRVASAALREHPAEITGAPLRSHRRTALTRRMTRALGPTAVLVAAAFLVGSVVPSLSWAGPTSVVLLPIAALVGWDRYRNLGHALTGRYLVSRQGSVARRTVALQRSGVIGWTVRQSIFQRRTGLVTLEAVTGAGAGGYPVLDLAAADAIALADAAVPGLLAPFLLAPPPTRP
ncbi:PH domain-containing protein [Pseudonocardia sp.]|uniref:PH domain-containing protein n=1 Tax=Pseudonocardia sp. TaxID=60912 RepID=UPI0026379A33|nr:PH domain-containing protein [Pseudonocardia sp.]MCW2722787.1 rane-flanked domain [Pseudonocardia sp.]